MSRDRSNEKWQSVGFGKRLDKGVGPAGVPSPTCAPEHVFLLQVLVEGGRAGSWVEDSPAPQPHLCRHALVVRAAWTVTYLGRVEQAGGGCGG